MEEPLVSVLQEQFSCSELVLQNAACEHKPFLAVMCFDTLNNSHQMHLSLKLSLFFSLLFLKSLKEKVILLTGPKYDLLKICSINIILRYKSTKKTERIKAKERNHLLQALHYVELWWNGSKMELNPNVS